jgi:hypothetical protein
MKFPNAHDQNSVDAEKALIEMLVKAIKSWNFTDPNNAEKDLEINAENLEKFPSADILFMTRIFTGQEIQKEGDPILSAEDKKKEQ